MPGRRKFAPHEGKLLPLGFTGSCVGVADHRCEDVRRPRGGPRRAHPGRLHIPSSCITALSNGGLFNARTWRQLRRGGWRSARRASRPSTRSSSARNSLTPLAPPRAIYAADVHFKSDAPLTSFTADWVVPPLPASHPFGRSQVVYFWPGFKATEPEMGYPVLQPVLQYGEHGHTWALQSWFVDAKQPKFPVVTAPAIDVQPGHRITSSMALSGDGSTWTVSGTNRDSGEDSTLHIAYSRAGATDYNYAMLSTRTSTTRTTACRRRPASRYQRTVLERDARGDARQLRRKPADCGNGASVAANGDDAELEPVECRAEPVDRGDSAAALAAAPRSPARPPPRRRPPRRALRPSPPPPPGRSTGSTSAGGTLRAARRSGFGTPSTRRTSTARPTTARSSAWAARAAASAVRFRTTAVADHKALCVSVEQFLW